MILVNAGSSIINGRALGFLSIFFEKMINIDTDAVLGVSPSAFSGRPPIA